MLKLKIKDGQIDPPFKFKCPICEKQFNEEIVKLPLSENIIIKGIEDWAITYIPGNNGNNIRCLRIKKYCENCTFNIEQFYEIEEIIRTKSKK